MVETVSLWDVTKASVEILQLAQYSVGALIPLHTAQAYFWCFVFTSNCLHVNVK